MSAISAGILMYRRTPRGFQVLLVHPGGPFFRNKDDGGWTIPKGLVNEAEDLLDAAKREFKEETGMEASGEFLELTPIKQKSGKIVHAWAVEGDLDASKIRSNTFEVEWPPKSGKRETFPEIDRAEFFDADIAQKKINPAQIALLDELSNRVC